METIVTRTAGTNKEETYSFEYPTFQGSEKQIAWAQSIFADKVRKLFSRADEAISEAPEIEEKVLGDVNSFLSKMSTKTNAAWWIDNRHSSLQEIIRSL